MKPGPLCTGVPPHDHSHGCFHTITGDPDDDAFADCAIAAEADYLITSDHHFAPLKGSGYKPQPITPEEFIRRFLQI